MSDLFAVCEACGLDIVGIEYDERHTPGTHEYHAICCPQCQQQTGEQMDNITTEKFLAYEDVRRSGLTNMWDTNRVIALAPAPLTRDDVLAIMKNYSELADLHLKETS